MAIPEGTFEQKWQDLRERGDPAALAFFFHQFYDELYFYCLKLSEEPSLAKDAVQNTFVDIWAYRLSLSPVSSPRLYFFRAVRNHCIKLLQKNNPRLDLESVAEQMTFQPEELEFDNAPNPIKTQLARALNELSPRQREIIYLKFYDNLEYREIAEVLQINYQSVVNHAHKAIIRLRQCDGLKNFF